MVCKNEGGAIRRELEEQVKEKKRIKPEKQERGVVAGGAFFFYF